jgi:hypothetical protein
MIAYFNMENSFIGRPVCRVTKLRKSPARAR